MTSLSSNIWQLIQERSKAFHSETSTLIQQLIMLTVETGISTALVVFLDLILFLAYPGKNCYFTLSVLLFHL